MHIEIQSYVHHNLNLICRVVLWNLISQALFSYMNYVAFLRKKKYNYT